RRTSTSSARSTTSRRWPPASSSRPSSASRPTPTTSGPRRTRSTSSSPCRSAGSRLPTRSAGSCGTSAAARCRSTSTRSTATSSGARRSGSPRTCSPCWATSPDAPPARRRHIRRAGGAPRDARRALRAVGLARDADRLRRPGDPGHDRGARSRLRPGPCRGAAGAGGRRAGGGREPGLSAALLARERGARGDARARAGRRGGARARGPRPARDLGHRPLLAGALPPRAAARAARHRRLPLAQGPRAARRERPRSVGRPGGGLSPHQPRAARQDRGPGAPDVPRQRPGAALAGRLPPPSQLRPALRLCRPPHLRARRQDDRPADPPGLRPGLAARQPGAGGERGPRRVRRRPRHLRQHRRHRPRPRGLLALRAPERGRRQAGRPGRARRPDRQDRGHGPRRRRPPPLQHHDPRRARRPGRVVGRALDARPRRGAPRRVPARGRERRLVSARGEQAAATLVRLGLDPEAVRAGRIGAEAVAPLLAGADGAALAAALGELASAEVAALLLALEPRAGERAVRKEIRRALYRLRQRGVPVPAPPAPAAAARTPAAPEAEGFLSRLTSEPPRPPAEPVSTRVTAPSAEESAALISGSAALLEEPELRSWFPPPEAAAPFVAEIAGLRDSPLVLSRLAEEERVREILGRAARALFPPAVLARRLPGTAYLLAETGRPLAARRALAVALV